MRQLIPAIEHSKNHAYSINRKQVDLFLRDDYLASKRGLDVLSYRDDAIGYMEPNESGRLSVTKVVLRPKIEFAGIRPPQAVVDELHHAAHDECFIANSIRTNIKIE